jgi:hypothetical protein
VHRASGNDIPLAVLNNQSLNQVFRDNLYANNPTNLATDGTANLTFNQNNVYLNFNNINQSAYFYANANLITNHVYYIFSNITPLFNYSSVSISSNSLVYITTINNVLANSNYFLSVRAVATNPFFDFVSSGTINKNILVRNYSNISFL